jgi:hypothetical protein
MTIRSLGILGAGCLLAAGACGGSVDPGTGDPQYDTERLTACSVESDCEGNERCFESQCVVDLCDDATPCSVDGACIDGACCYSEEECGLCDSEDCMGGPSTCVSGADCESDERCFEGACVAVLCDDTSPCSEGGACIDGACCYSDEDCGLCDSEDC